MALARAAYNPKAELLLLDVPWVEVHLHISGMIYDFDGVSLSLSHIVDLRTFLNDIHRQRL